MNNRTTIKHVLNNCQISERLRGGLTMYAGFFKVEYLDEVEPTLMRERIINVGKLTEKELIELKDKFKYYEKHTHFTKISIIIVSLY